MEKEYTRRNLFTFFRNGERVTSGSASDSSSNEIFNANGNPYTIENPTIDTLMKNVDFSRRDFIWLGFILGTAIGSFGSKILIDRLLQDNPVLNTLLNYSFVESRADHTTVTYTLEEIKHLWSAILGDSIARGQADNEMKMMYFLRPILLHIKLQQVMGMAILEEYSYLIVEAT